MPCYEGITQQKAGQNKIIEKKNPANKLFFFPEIVLKFELKTKRNNPLQDSLF
jgi:hypothetical protein